MGFETEVGFLLILGLLWMVQSSQDNFVICVRKTKHSSQDVKQCNILGQLLSSSGIHLRCVQGEGRLDCLKKVAKNQSDVMFTMYPEDIAIAGEYFPDDLVVLATVHKPGQESVKEEVVAIVKNSSGISNLTDLAGKNACFPTFQMTGDREGALNLATRAIIRTLWEEGELNLDCEEEMSQLERELSSLEGFFGPSCLPGNWGSGPSMDAALKENYSNLCAICHYDTSCTAYGRVPRVTDSLHCLMDSGDVAWTTLSIIKEEIGVWSQEYNFLCPEGFVEEFDLSEDAGPCSWGAKPWPVFLARKSLGKDNLTELLRQLNSSFTMKDSNARYFITKTFQGNVRDDDEVFAEQLTLTPAEYLHYNGYLSITGRHSCNESNSLRICTVGEMEERKCEDMSMAIYGRTQNEDLSCVTGESLVNCMEMVRMGQADVVSLDAGLNELAEMSGDFQTILKGVTSHLSVYYVVAMVKTSSGLRSMEDLRGKRSCHSSHGENDFGWYFPSKVLQTRGFIPNDTCSMEETLGAFFNNSCVYGEQLDLNDSVWGNTYKLCAACDQKENISTCPKDVHIDGEEAAFRCLQHEKGDVAFINIYRQEDNNYKYPKYEKYVDRLGDFHLICPNQPKGAKTIGVVLCNWGSVVARIYVVMSATSKVFQVEDAQILLQGLADLAITDDVLLKPFGSYHGYRNLLFDDSITSFLDSSQMDTSSPERVESNYISVADRIHDCSDKIKFTPSGLNKEDVENGNTDVCARCNIVLMVILTLLTFLSCC